MANNDVIEVEGIVVKCLPGQKFLVEIFKSHTITATISGKLQMNYINILLGDRVSVQMSPYDLTRGRITWRHK